MPIKSSCKCGFSFNAKDALAGKNVKCPRCQEVVRIASQAGKATVAATAGNETRKVNKRLLDLLDDAGVRSTPKGPVCAACGDEMNPTAIICIGCGYNVATGQYLETYTDQNYEAETETAGMTTGQKAMAKAQKEIAEIPIGADDQDFGDGADSYIIAMAGFAIFSVLVLLGLGVVLIMDSITNEINPAMISAIASSTIYVACALFITIIGFKSRPSQAIACVLTAGLYCMIYGFMQGRGTIGAAAIQIISMVIGGGSWLYCKNTGLI